MPDDCFLFGQYAEESLRYLSEAVGACLNIRLNRPPMLSNSEYQGFRRTDQLQVGITPENVSGPISSAGYRRLYLVSRQSTRSDGRAPKYNSGQYRAHRDSVVLPCHDVNGHPRCMAAYCILNRQKSCRELVSRLVVLNEFYHRVERPRKVG